MKTFLNVNLALLPLAILTILFASGMRAEAIYAGMVASLLIGAVISALCKWWGPLFVA